MCVIVFNGVEFRTSASKKAAYIHQKHLTNMSFTAFLLGDECERNGEEEKSTSLLVVLLRPSCNEILLFSCGRQMVGSISLPVVVAKSD